MRLRLGQKKGKIRTSAPKLLGIIFRQPENSNLQILAVVVPFDFRRARGGPADSLDSGQCRSAKLMIVKEAAGVPLRGICERCDQQFDADPHPLGKAKDTIQARLMPRLQAEEQWSAAFARFGRDDERNAVFLRSTPKKIGGLRSSSTIIGYSDDPGAGACGTRRERYGQGARSTRQDGPRAYAGVRFFEISGVCSRNFHIGDVQSSRCTRICHRKRQGSRSSHLVRAEVKAVTG